MTAPRPVRMIEGEVLGSVRFDALVAGDAPVLLKGPALDLPLARAGRAGPAVAADYLRRFDAGQPVTGFRGDPAIGGRFFYNDALTGMNFSAGRALLAEHLAFLAEHLDDPDAPSLYLGSTDLDTYLPGLRAENEIVPDRAAIGGAAPLASIWIGNRTVAATHWDMSNNIAACMAGRRRFTLFPPDQVGNLYPGPLEPTPAGQVVSMVDARAPDLGRYPRFADALAHAQVAEMEPGDVLVYPALWWHQVEALDGFNILVNYWWNEAPAYADTPMTTLLHGILALRDRPLAEKRAWRALFDQYLFGPAERAGEHLPPHARGALGALDEAGARRLRAQILHRLNR